MSQSSQSQRQSRPRPAVSRTGGKTPARSSGRIGLPSNRRGRLSILALLLALAALLLVPAVVFADHQVNKSSTPTATTGGGTMTVQWTTTHGATGGYQYRYTNNFLVTLGNADPPEWSDERSTSNTSVTIASGILTPGHDLLLPGTRQGQRRPDQLRRGIGLVRWRGAARHAIQARRCCRDGWQYHGYAVMDRGACI